MIATRPERLRRVTVSHAGSVMGTPAYMAPEQAAGEIERIDERADVFALGSILCEVLTGRPAYTGRTGGEIRRKAALGDLADALARLDACGADAGPDRAGPRLPGPRARGPPPRRRRGGRADHRLPRRRAGAAPAAERERAMAEARRDRGAQPRRLQLGLAALILGMMTLGGLRAAYELQRRHARDTRVYASSSPADVITFAR